MPGDIATAYFAIKNFALSTGALPREIKLLRFGDNPTDRGTFKVTQRTLDAIKEQVAGGVYERVLIDFEHNSHKDSPTYQPPPRHHAGAGVVFCSADDGLVLRDVTWTPEGEKFGRGYPDISPVVAYDKSTLEVTGLTSAGLVPNSGVIGLSFFSPIETPQKGTTQQETGMDPKELKAQMDALAAQFAELKKLVEGMMPKETVEEVAAMSAKVVAIEGALTPLKTLKADMDAAFARRDKEALLVQAAFAGKVPQLTDEAIVKLSVDDLRAHIEKLPVTVPMQLRTALFAPKPQTGEGDLLAQFNAITDPVKRGEFYAKHKDIMFSAS